METYLVLAYDKNGVDFQFSIRGKDRLETYSAALRIAEKAGLYVYTVGGFHIVN